MLEMVLCVCVCVCSNPIFSIYIHTERVQAEVLEEGGVSLLAHKLQDKVNKEVAHWALYALGNLCDIG